MSEREDSIDRLLEDLDRAAAEAAIADYKEVWAAYAGDRKPDASTDTYSGDVLVDAARRLHALMPHDMNGREIKSGDKLRFSSGGTIQVCALKIAPAYTDGDGSGIGVITINPEKRTTVVEPDSWERLQEDAKLTPRDYLRGHGIEANEYGRVSTMAADILRRAKALAGVE